MSELPAVLRSLHRRARDDRKRIVLPEVEDPRTAKARDRLTTDGLADVIWIESPRDDPNFEQVVEHIYERRRQKGLDYDGAVELARTPLYFAASLTALGHADASVAGAAHTTAEVIRAAIHCVGTKSDTLAVSSMFLMVRGDTVYSYADCGVLPDPDAAQLAAIGAVTAHNHHLFTGDEPRVAFLSFSTKGSAEHARVDKVREGLKLFREQQPEIRADGELQFDTAVVPAIASKKSPGSPLAGDANVFIFPDLDAGNLAYKITERLGNFQAFGPVIQGLEKPCLDLSRACTADDIVNVAVIASIMTTVDGL